MLPTISEAAAGEYGEVFTKRWVVELILDLCGYTSDRPLHDLVALEPACGTGAFVLPMVDRLIASVEASGTDLREAREAIVATDLLRTNVELTRAKVSAALCRAGLSLKAADRLALEWIRHDDFLLSDAGDRSADVAVGNPPYIRLEAVPRQRSAAYRRACPTMGGRADVYVGFYEKALHALRDGGCLGFICADRWMRNAYGASLRSLIAEEWAVEAIVAMTGVDAFEDEVDAYPAVTVIRRARQSTGPIVVETAPEFGEVDARDLATFAGDATQDARHATRYSAARLRTWFSGRAGWPTGNPDQLDCLADLEDRFAPLEDVQTGTKVGIGVATGADRVFIVNDHTTAEPERMLRLALSRDLTGGTVSWSGAYLVNPWSPSGLVELSEWPRLAGYLGQHREALSRRHAAKSGHWHKTIDRVVHGLVDRPKLYLPDFAERLAPVLDEGGTYPHHNLYWIVSDDWELPVLGGMLMSDVANFFVRAYSVRMRGGYLRFQAQYLRRVRLPRPGDIDAEAKAALADAFRSRDHAAATRIALPIYGLTDLP